MYKLFWRRKKAAEVKYTTTFTQLATDQMLTTGLLPSEMMGTGWSELCRIAGKDRPCRNPYNCGNTVGHVHGFDCTPTCTVCGKVK